MVKTKKRVPVVKGATKKRHNEDLFKKRRKKKRDTVTKALTVNNKNKAANLTEDTTKKIKESKPGKTRLQLGEKRGSKKRGKRPVKIVDSNENVKAPPKNVRKLDVKKLQRMLVAKEEEKNSRKEGKKERVRERKVREKRAGLEPLRDRMMAKLRASRFRFLNETLYNSDSAEAKKYFKEDPDAFTAYHDGYRQQVEQWPINPLDVIISSIEKLPKDHIIADFGCGEAKLAASVNQTVHSFDFVAANDRVKACDMAHTPLLTGGANVVVFCLSLMGTNLTDYIIEANRVLKKDGILKIAEVESRFDSVEQFINALTEYGFKNIWKDFSHNLFYFMDFKKEQDITGKRSKLPEITLKPCLYKKR